MKLQTSLSDKTYLIYGLGLTGKSSLEFLIQEGASCQVFLDPGLSDQDLEEAQAYCQEWNVPLLMDSNDLDWDCLTVLVKSPGIGLDKDLLHLAKEKGLEVISDLELAYRLFPQANWLAITGSNGKTTTTLLTEHVLKANGLPAVSLGNIGKGILETLGQVGEDTILVTECSSFQLASSPSFVAKWAAILNISPDHLDWHGSMEEYVKSKAQLANNMKWGSSLYLDRTDMGTVLLMEYLDSKAKLEFIEQRSKIGMALRESEKWPLAGEHNIKNALFAAGFAKEFGIEEEAIIDALESFEPIAHRLEPLDFEGLDFRIYNDSKATNVDSTVRAMESFQEPLVLIIGGMDKNISFEPLYERAAKQVKSLICMGETGPKLAQEAKDFGLEMPIWLVENLDQAVEKALASCETGDVLLFSPASASWDAYRNFEERGQHFKQLIGQYLGQALD